jgi:hypothetical protein
MKVAVLGFLLSVASPDVLPALEQPAAPPAVQRVEAFKPGERLTYSIAWFSIPAGTTVMEVGEGPVIQGRAAYRLVTTAQTNKFVSSFYPVDSRVESILDANTWLPQRLLFKRREGKRKNDFDVTFHHPERRVYSIKDGVAETISIPEGAQDGLSCLYYLRGLPNLTPGTSVFINVHHDRKNYKVEIKVEGTEKMKSPWGEVETLRILAVMPFQGIFLNEGNIRVWVTNDARRIPVLMRAKVVVGAVTATLVEGAGVLPPR